jgi:hypothetical protein
MTRKCAACGVARSDADLLLVTDRRHERPPAVICRYTVDSRCFEWAGPASRTEIRLLTPPILGAS